VNIIPHAVHVPIIENARSLAHWEEFGNDIVFVNLNRNTHRKRLDIYACAAARFLARHPDAPVRFLANSHHESAFDLHSIALRELVACGIEDPMPLLNRIMINRTMLTDDMVTYIHNACDVAVNCSEGEGFGLCVAEAACVGKPVIVSGVGGALDLFGSRIPTAPPVAYVIPPVAEYFLDGRDGIGGCARLISVNDLVKAFEHFMHVDNRVEYGKRAKDHMAFCPSWKDISKMMLDFIRIRDGNMHTTTSGTHA
jgi:glycosyltransferase involved in cell wall biosynthesis